MSKAQEALKPYESLPTALPADFTPLSRKPEAGKKVVYLANSLPYEQQVARDVASAASAVGWTSQTINFDSTVEDLNAKMQQAIAQSPQPDVIMIAGWPIAAIKQSVEAAKDAGILVVDSAVADVPSETTGFAATSGGPRTFAERGKVMANWVLADSGCDANVVMFSLPYPIFDSVDSGFKETFDADCPKCGYKYQELSIQDSGTPAAVAAMVSAVQADPSVKYVGVTNGDLAQGLVPALKQAGLTDVKIFGEAPASANYAALQDGSEAMYVAAPAPINAWEAFDSALRVLDTGEPFPGFISPIAVLTKDNVPADSTESSAFPQNYESLFKTLWMVG